MATVRSLNAIKRRRATRQIEAAATTAIMGADQDVQKTMTFTVDSNGDVVSSVHALGAETLLDNIDGLVVDTPTAMTIERNPDTTLTLT